MKKLKILVILMAMFCIISCQAKLETIKIDIPNKLKLGDKIELIVEGEPEGIDEKITVTVADDKAIIDGEYLYAAKLGKTTITATSESGIVSSLDIEIVEPEIEIKELTLVVGQKVEFADEIISENEYIKFENKQITANKAGECIVEAVKRFEHNIEYKYNVTIKISEFVVSYKDVMEVGDTFELTSNVEFEYTLEGESVQIENNTVKAIAEGTSYITVKVPNTDVEKRFEIKVIASRDEVFEMAKELATPIDKIDKYPFVNEVTVGNEIFIVTWEFPEGMVENDLLLRQETNKTYEVKAIIANQGLSKEFTYQFEMMSGDEFLSQVAEKITVPEEIDNDIELPNEYNGVIIEWTSSKRHILSPEGKIAYVSEPVEIELEATLVYNDEYFYDLAFKVVVKTFSDERCMQAAIETIKLPEIATSNLALKTSFNYGTKAYWISSNEEVINHLGHVTLTDKVNTVELTVRVYVTDDQVYLEKKFMVDTKAVKLNEGEEYFAGHNYLSYAKDITPLKQENIKLNGDRFELVDNAVKGYYESNVVYITPATEVVASWSAITSVTANIEVQVRVKIGDSWSKYFTYGKWGLGAENLYYNQTDTLAKMSVDEIIATGGDIVAFQYRVDLTRDKAASDSPKVLLVAIAINIDNYYYGVDTTGLPSQVDYDVPKLNQNEVPTIGSVICSATTTTMLLKYHGMSFADKDSQYEHRYIAGLVKDMGHQSPTYGNWVFNMAVAGAYGFDAKVSRMYSWEELKYHLATVGPVGASIGGDFGLYTTGGHLIVVRGYREENGKTVVITNDPNVNTRFGEQYYVYYEVSLEMFMNVWGGVVYIVE